MAPRVIRGCLYEVLGLSRDCSADDIRSAYKRAALERHPDKLIRSGVPEAESTAAFQELVNAYEVLSDKHERAWYDSHRSEILFSSSTAGAGSNFVPELFSFFSNSVYSGYSDSAKGFYKVYGDLFEKIYSTEFNFAKKLGLPLPKGAPGMGNLDSLGVKVTSFYDYWLGFGTVMDFSWVKEKDGVEYVGRWWRKAKEEKNKKLRRKTRSEYNERVRRLARFVQRRDKRVIDMEIKRSEEIARKKEEEKQRKKVEIKARSYEEVEMDDDDDEVYEDEDECEDDEGEKKNYELLYCVVCGKKFKSDKQWKNHERSKKHKEKVAELREAFSEEDDDQVKKGCEEKFEEGCVGNEGDDSDAESDVEDEKAGSSYSGENGVDKELGSDDSDENEDDEARVLEAMLWGRRSRNNKVEKIEVEIDDDDDDSDELMEFIPMEYNNTKGSRRNKGGNTRRRKRRAARQEAEEDDDVAETNGNGEVEEDEGMDN